VKDQTIQFRKCNILGIRFDLISYALVMETIERWRANGESNYVTLTNPYCVTLSRRDPEMRRAIEMAEMTLPDGVGIILAARLLGCSHHGRVSGPILMLKMCDWGCKYGYRHYFYGGDNGVAKKLAERLSSMYPGLQVAGTYCPPFRQLTNEEENDIVEKINSTNPDIVWIGLGAPKQEKWMADNLGRIAATVMIGVGAAFDYHSGAAKWAPRWIQKLGIEWLYGIAFRPRRTLPKLLGTLTFGAGALGFCIKQKLWRRTPRPSI
jgi:N-acetylglucosaminyldiphosphoundecaprenol N-acetyl-beta-D-mannosaminyltransferase